MPLSLSSKNNLRLTTDPCLPRGSITMESLECGKNFKKAEPKGKYCCVCKNYGGKIVDGEKVSLHRFPANEKENLVWRKRVQFVMVPGFKITKFSRLCSHRCAERPPETACHSANIICEERFQDNSGN